MMMMNVYIPFHLFFSLVVIIMFSSSSYMMVFQDATVKNKEAVLFQFTQLIRSYIYVRPNMCLLAAMCRNWTSLHIRNSRLGYMTPGDVMSSSLMQGAFMPLVDATCCRKALNQRESMLLELPRTDGS